MIDGESTTLVLIMSTYVQYIGTMLKLFVDGILDMDKCPDVLFQMLLGIVERLNYCHQAVEMDKSMGVILVAMGNDKF